jgi:hypothetical protein
MRSPPTDPREVTTKSARIVWEPTSRVAVIHYSDGADLVASDGVDLVETLTNWIGTTTDPFGVLADTTGLHGTDGEYRAKAGSFFRHHRGTAFIALIKPGPVIQIVAELFRIGTGVQLKVFATEDAARSWLRTKGIAA